LHHFRRNDTIVHLPYVASGRSPIVHAVIFAHHVRNDVITSLNQAYSEYKHSLTFRVRRYVIIATKPVQRLQIRLTVYN